MTEQRDFFRDVERDYWAGADGLKDEEQALIERFLDPSRATVDAGTGGGRIARALHGAGFQAVSGYDFTPELIDAAKAHNPNSEIDFRVADATGLSYDDESFGQALYLQQVVCTIDDAGGRAAAMREAARILEPGGVALFSFVCFESRLGSRSQRVYVRYLRARRWLARSKRPVQSMPRLRLRGRADALGALRDRGPYNWWYRATEAEADLATAGLEVTAMAFGPAVVESDYAPGADQLLAKSAGGTLYVTCRKPA